VLTKPVGYRAAKITAAVTSQSGANVSTQEMILAHSASANDVTLTIYGTVAAPATSNLGSFSAAINTTALALKFHQTGASSLVKMFIQFIK
jgi:hypothetical protein